MAYEQAFAWWTFSAATVPAQSLLEEAARIGYRGVDFLPQELWACARDLGLEPTIIDGHVPLEIGFNDRAHHRNLSDQVRSAIDLAQGAGIRFVAVASGNRTPSAADGMGACAEGLAPLAAQAHAAGVVLLIEPLNSKIDHPGHECDRTEWAAELVDRVNSPSLRILYDFYHAQIMEGDLLRTVDKHMSRIAHLHTAGVPGRHDIDELQEINWAAIARMLTARDYVGFVSHEFIPHSDPFEALRRAYAVFSVETR